MFTRKLLSMSKGQHVFTACHRNASTLIFKRMHEDSIPKDQELPVLPECRILEPKLDIYRVKRIINGPFTLKVILSKDSIEYGVKGELVELRKHIARGLIHQGAAVYASPENLKKYKENWSTSSQSIYARRMLLYLRKSGLLVCPISETTKWELNNHIVARLLEKYHGIVCDVSSITMPDYPIKSTDSDVWEKIHKIKITINKLDSEYIQLQLTPWQPVQT